MNPIKKIYSLFILAYSKLVAMIIKSEDKQRRKSYLKRRELSEGTEVPFHFKLKKYLSLKLGRKKFSLKEQLLFIDTIIVATKFSNPLQEPLIFMSKRLDVRPYIQKVCKKIAEELNNSTFSKSLNEYQALSGEYIALIGVTERTGEFLPNYEYISQNLRERINRASKVKNLMIYPTIVIILMVGIEIMVATYLAPQIIDIYEEGEIMPNILVSYQNLSNLLLENTLQLVLGVIGSILLLIWLIRLKPTKFLLHALIMQVPKIKDLVVKWEISKFFQSVNAMTKGSSSTKEALKTSLPLISNTLIRFSLNVDIQDKIDKTHHLYDILKDNPFIEERVKNQLRLSKESNASGLEVMESIVEDYKDSLNTLLSAPLALITPILLAIVSVYIFTRLIPLFNAVNSFSF